jgi:hypothetical protein
MPDAPQKDDLQIIFSEDKVTVGDKVYVIKPWTLKQLMGVWPLLTVLAQSVQQQMGLEGAKTLSFDDITTLLTEEPQVLIQILLPYVPKFFFLSINNITEEEAVELDAGTASIMLLKILACNIGHLKNSLSLVVREMTVLTEAMTQSPSSEQ